MTAAAGAVRRVDPFPWRGVVTLMASVAVGPGSVLAVILGIVWRRDVTSPRDRTLLRVGLVLGSIGLVVTVLALAVVMTSKASPS